MVTRDNEFHLIINDECLVAWMAINNTFTREKAEDWPTDKRYWDGVFFQLGEYKRLADGKYMDILGNVTFYDTDTVILTLSAAEIKKANFWINIVADRLDSTRADPMDSSSLPRLLASGKSLHNYFKPYGSFITFWQNNKAGYSLVATQDGNGGFHNRYEFTCPFTDDFRVEINLSRVKPASLKRVTRIIISEEGGGDHGDFMNPPQRP